VRSLNTAKAELEEPEEPDDEEEPDELAEPAAERPALDEEEPAPVALDPDPLEELLVLDAFVVPLPDTISPT
jgi:hypothetical protein